MDPSRTLVMADIPVTLLNELDSRDVALWITDSFFQEQSPEALADTIRLPWKAVFNEGADAELVRGLEAQEDAADPLVRKRGFIQIIDANPADVILPPRALPVYLLNGRDLAASRSGLGARTNRLTMLDALRRLAPKEVVILQGSGAFPTELSELWQDERDNDPQGGAGSA